MQKRLLIFGGGGFVGGNLAKRAMDNNWRVFIGDSFFRPGLENAEWHTVDISDKDSVDEIMQRVLPDAVVNVAAIADIDKAEMDKELAYKINVTGASNIAAACNAYGASYVFFSSDAVYNGEKASFTEEDKPDPVNYYGYTKAEAENKVLTACPGAKVIRISLVLGFPVTGGNSFLATLEKKLKNRQEVDCPINEIRTPIDVYTLCDCVLELADNDFKGILNLGSRGSINRYDLAFLLTRNMGLDTSLLRIQSDDGLNNGRAKRHRNGVVVVDKAAGILKTRLLSLEEALEKSIYVEVKKNEQA